MPVVSLIIPVFNYASRVNRTISCIHEFCQDHEKDWEVLFVDDGSTDQTAAAIKTLIEPYPYMRLIRQPGNMGKGAAVRKGLQESKGEYHIFTDVDLAYNLNQTEKIVEALKDGADFAFADRRHPASICKVDKGREEYSQKRDFMSYVLNQMTRRIGIGNIRDTQAGLKGIRKEVNPVLRKGAIDGFPFDIEMFVIGRANNLKMEAIPVEYRIEDAPSTVMPIPVALDFLKSIRTIRKKMINGAYYAMPNSAH